MCTWTWTSSWFEYFCSIGWIWTWIFLIDQGPRVDRVVLRMSVFHAIYHSKLIRGCKMAVGHCSANGIYDRVACWKIYLNGDKMLWIGLRLNCIATALIYRLLSIMIFVCCTLAVDVHNNVILIINLGRNTATPLTTHGDMLSCPLYLN